MDSETKRKPQELKTCGLRHGLQKIDADLRLFQLDLCCDYCGSYF